MKINGLMTKAKWESIPCVCNKEYPIKPCEFHRCEIAWLSVPKKSFKINEEVLDKNEKHTGKFISREIKEITLVRGKIDDIQGWIIH
jgi:uncharacterized protein YaaR (DUF327 family)